MKAGNYSRSLARDNAQDPPTPFEHTTIADRSGVEHDYRTHYIPAGKAFDLALEVLEIAGGELDKLDTGEDANSLTMIAAMGEGLSGIARRLLRAGGHKKVMQILAYTSRDGDKLGAPGIFQRCYTGNQLELFKALVWVLKINFEDFFGADSLSGGLVSPEERENGAPIES